MATVRLTRYECERNLLPRVCARCGAPAHRVVQFVLRSPVSIYLLACLMLACPPLFAMVFFRRRPTREYDVPMCEADQMDWKWRDRLTTYTFYILAGTYCLCALLIILLPEMTVVFLLGYFVVWYAWHVPTPVLWTRTVRTTKVMKGGIRLSGVHPDFIRALMADRVAARESDPQRAAWYGDLRDDFEEDWNEFGAFRPDAARETAPQAEPDAPARAD